MALTTTGEVKKWLGLGVGVTKYDERIGLFLTALEQRVQTYLGGRILARGERTEIVNGTGREFLRLAHRPIVSITSVAFSHTQEWTEPSNIIDPASFKFRADAGLLYRKSGLEWPGDLAQAGATFPEGNANIRVVYVGGFETIPADVSTAVQIAALDFLGRALQITGGEPMAAKTMQSISGSNSGSYADELDRWSGLPAQALAYLRPYRNW